MLVAATSPARDKLPPIYRLPEPSTTTAWTRPFAPGIPPTLIQLASLKVAAATTSGKQGKANATKAKHTSADGTKLRLSLSARQRTEFPVFITRELASIC